MSPQHLPHVAWHPHWPLGEHDHGVPAAGATAALACRGVAGCGWPAGTAGDKELITVSAGDPGTR